MISRFTLPDQFRALAVVFERDGSEFVRIGETLVDISGADAITLTMARHPDGTPSNFILSVERGTTIRVVEISTEVD